MSKNLVGLVTCLSLVMMYSCAVGDIITLPPEQSYASGPQTDQAEIDLVLSNFYGVVLPEVYQAVLGPSVLESGSAAGFYTAAFSPNLDSSSATITWDGGQSIIKASYLLVKGNDGPAGLASWHLFTIPDWNGTDTISMSNFWPGEGAMSRVRIYGDIVSVPEPASVGLFGLGMGCVSGSFIRRRRG